MKHCVGMLVMETVRTVSVFWIVLFHVHSYQDQFIQPGWAECVLLSLGLYFVCLYCFNLFVCPHPFVFP